MNSFLQLVLVVAGVMLSSAYSVGGARQSMQMNLFTSLFGKKKQGTVRFTHIAYAYYVCI
jgi:hypothetical protein